MTQLVVNQRGTSLSVKNGCYCVRSKEQELFLPVHTVKTISLHPATRLTYEVVLAAIEQQTDVLFVDRKGFPIGRIWSHRFGSISTIRKQQLLFACQSTGREWVRGVLVRKLDNQIVVIDLLSALCGDDLAGQEKTTYTLHRYKDKIKAVDASDLSECFASFRGLEGSASRTYFAQLNLFLPERYHFQKRTYRTASDAFNCLLNYAYGMLYGLCESALIQAGIDPFIGVMHRDDYNRPVLVYDFIELFRAWADYVVCHLLLQEVVFDEFFDKDAAGGSLWLNTSGKRILIQSFNDYLAEVIAVDGLMRSRLQHILLEAQRLASMLKKLV